MTVKLKGKVEPYYEAATAPPATKKAPARTPRPDLRL